MGWSAWVGDPQLPGDLTWYLAVVLAIMNEVGYYFLTIDMSIAGDTLTQQQAADCLLDDDQWYIQL
jgi:hypothetical protein